MIDDRHFAIATTSHDSQPTCHDLQPTSCDLQTISRDSQSATCILDNLKNLNVTSELWIILFL